MIIIGRLILSLLLVVWIFWETGFYSVTLLAFLLLLSSEMTTLLINNIAREEAKWPKF